MVGCTKECGFVLRDKENWVDEISAHWAYCHAIFDYISWGGGWMLKSDDL